MGDDKTEVWVKLTELSSEIRHASDTTNQNISELKGAINERNKAMKEGFTKLDEKIDRNVEILQSDISGNKEMLVERVKKLEDFKYMFNILWIAGGVVFAAISYMLGVWDKIVKLIS